MAVLWLRGAGAAGEGWACMALEGGEAVELGAGPPRRRRSAEDVPGGRALVVPLRGGGGRWVVVAPPAACLRLNGLALAGGIRVLRDRDEIRIGDDGVTMYFSTETAARVVPFAGGGTGAAACARCRQPIAGGSPSACCGGCGIAYHASDELPCFEYAAGCAVCGHPTVLDGEFRWTPEGA